MVTKELDTLDPQRTDCFILKLALCNDERGETMIREAPGAYPWVDKTYRLLSDLSCGVHPIDARTWLNLTNQVHGSAEWTNRLAARGFCMPNPHESFHQMQIQTRKREAA
jgi:hypothetical protein